eukprot:gene1959-3805_t
MSIRLDDCSLGPADLTRSLSASCSVSVGRHMLGRIFLEYKMVGGGWCMGHQMSKRIDRLIPQNHAGRNNCLAGITTAALPFLGQHVILLHLGLRFYPLTSLLCLLMVYRQYP